MALRVGYVPDVDASFLVPNDYNPNVLTATLRKKLRENIQREGFIDPLTVTPSPEANREYNIIDGEHRFLVGRDDLGMKAFPCVVLSTEDGGPVVGNRARLLTQNLNDLRGENDPIKLAAVIRTLSGEMSLAEIANVTVYSEEQLEALRVYEGLDTDALAAATERNEAARGDVELIFLLTPDQAETVNGALTKAKGTTKADKLVRIARAFLGEERRASKGSPTEPS